MLVHEATQMTDFTASSSAYEKNLDIVIRKELKTMYLHYPLTILGFLGFIIQRVIKPQLEL